MINRSRVGLTKKQSLCFLNKIIGILENHSESLSFSLSLQEKRGIEKKRETRNDSLECKYIYSKSPGSGLTAKDPSISLKHKLINNL